MKTFLASCLYLAVLVCAATGEERELLKEYRGAVSLPVELYQAYADLVAAFQGGKKEEIEKLCLPGKIRITTTPRPKDKADYGKDINLPFLKDRFHKYILNLRKDSDTAWLIRTGSTAFWFARTEDGHWKLAEYLDKPIE